MCQRKEQSATKGIENQDTEIQSNNPLTIEQKSNPFTNESSARQFPEKESTKRSSLEDSKESDSDKIKSLSQFLGIISNKHVYLYFCIQLEFSKRSNNNR